jgi:hypothetical protein
VRVTGKPPKVTGEPPLSAAMAVMLSLCEPVTAGVNTTLMLHVPPVADVMPVVTHELDGDTENWAPVVKVMALVGMASNSVVVVTISGSVELYPTATKP